MLNIQSIIASLHDWAPRSLAWEKDNIGLLLGSARAEVRRVLVCLDITPAVVAEAVELEAQAIIAHHPLIFRPLRSIDTDSEKGQMIAALLRENIAVIAMHTNADAAKYGLNHGVAALLGLRNCRALEPAADKMLRLTVHIQGGGEGIERAAEFLRAHGELTWSSHSLDGGVVVIDVEMAEWQSAHVVRSLRFILEEAVVSMRSHRLSDPLPNHGIGVVGSLDGGMTALAFIQRIKEQLGCTLVRTSTGDMNRIVRTVALCTGSGSSYIGRAVGAGADLYLTGDLTHHDFLDHGSALILVDAGHHETERVFIDLCVEELENTVFEDNQKIDILPSRTDTNPIRFL